MQTKGKILVINDDEETMSLLRMWLTENKYTAEYTSDYNNIFEIINNFQPDLLIIDFLQMAVAERIRHENKFSEIPILLMTGYSENHNHTCDLADDKIEKPFDLDNFKERIENLISFNK